MGRQSEMRPGVPGEAGVNSHRSVATRRDGKNEQGQQKKQENDRDPAHDGAEGRRKRDKVRTSGMCRPKRLINLLYRWPNVCRVEMYTTVKDE